MRRRHPIVAVIVAVALGLGGWPAAASDDSKNLGVFKHWTAMRYAEQSGPACMMWTQPEKSEGKYKKRDDPYVFVTHRPAAKRFDVVSIDTGYPFKDSSNVSVTIESTHFVLRSAGSTAWTQEVRDNVRLVQAMRAGREMVVEGVSSRGTKTRDTYSLSGFTAAHKAINHACKRP